MRKTCKHLSLGIVFFVVRYLDSIIPLVSISEISSLYLDSVAEQASLSLNWWETPKTGFLMTWLFCIFMFFIGIYCKLFKFASDLFSQYWQGRYFCENKLL